MRRLMHYLRPYWRQVALGARRDRRRLCRVAGPALPHQGRHRPPTSRRAAGGPQRPRALYLAVLVIAFAAEYVQTWTMQLTGQRIMFDLRMAIYGHLQRLDLRYYDRNPVGRLMTRVTSDVDVMNDLFTSGVVTVFGDLFALVGIMGMMVWMNWRLALVAFFGPTAHPSGHAMVPQPRAAIRIGWSADGFARINAFLQENITRHVDGAAVPPGGAELRALRRIDRKHRDANIESIFYYAVFYPAIEAVSTLASALIIWYGGAGASVARDADARRAGRVSPVLAAVLPPDQRHVGEVQRPAIGDGLVRAHLQAARRAGDDRIVRTAGASPGPRAWPHPVRGRLVRIQRRRPSRTGSSKASPSRSAPAPRRHRRRHRLRQDDVDQPAAAFLRREAGGESPSMVSTSASSILPTSAGCSASFCRTCTCSPARWPTTSPRQPVHRRRARASGGARGARGAVHRAPCRTPTRARSPNAVSTLSVGQKQLLSFAPRAGLRPARPDSRRGHVEHRYRNRVDDPRRASRFDGEAHDDRDRAPVSTIQNMDNILVLHKGQLRESGTHQELLAERGIYFKLFELQYKASDRPDVRSDFRRPAQPPAGTAEPEAEPVPALEESVEEARRRRARVPPQTQHGQVNRPASELQRLVAAHM